LRVESNVQPVPYVKLEAAIPTTLVNPAVTSPAYAAVFVKSTEPNSVIHFPAPPVT